MWKYILISVCIIIVLLMLYTQFSRNACKDKWDTWANGPIVNYLSGTRSRKDKSQNWNLCCNPFYQIGHAYIHNTHKCSLDLNQNMEDTKTHFLHCPHFWKINPGKTKHHLLDSCP